MTVQEFRRIGKKVFGSGWQTKLSKHPDFHVSSRTVRRWASGESPIPRMVGLSLVLLLQPKE